jgi:hypothetical protein
METLSACTVAGQFCIPSQKTLHAFSTLTAQSPTLRLPRDQVPMWLDILPQRHRHSTLLPEHVNLRDLPVLKQSVAQIHCFALPSYLSALLIGFSILLGSSRDFCKVQPVSKGRPANALKLQSSTSSMGCHCSAGLSGSTLGGSGIPFNRPV